MAWPTASSLLPDRDADAREALRDALRILRAGIQAVDPARSTAAAVVRGRDGWRMGHGTGAVRFPRSARFHVLAAGKASLAMARGFADRAPVASMLVVAPAGERERLATGTVLYAAHPTPDGNSFRAGRRARTLAGKLGPADVLVLLVSGGASSLLEDPAVPPSDYRRCMEQLLRAGLPIEDLNAVRKHLSNVKGGRLALAAASRGVPVVALLLSDVPSDRLDTIGGGLAAPDATTVGDARRVLRERGLWARLPAKVRRHLERGGTARESPKEDDEGFRLVTNVLVASNATARVAMAAKARRLGRSVRVAGSALTGEAYEAGRSFGRRLVAAGARPGVVVAGGETTVRVEGGGTGGRNQEFALGAAVALRGQRALVLAFGSDGVDGNSRNAGAVVDGLTVERARAAGTDPETARTANDSAGFFERAGGAVRTGPTGTNVADLVVGVTW